MAPDMELDYRLGRMSSRDITFLRGRMGRYGGTADPKDPGVPIRILGCSFDWETRMEVTAPGQPTKQIKILCPWLKIESTDPDFPGDIWIRLGDPDLRLD